VRWGWATPWGSAGSKWRQCPEMDIRGSRAQRLAPRWRSELSVGLRIPVVDSRGRGVAHRRPVRFRSDHCHRERHSPGAAGRDLAATQRDPDPWPIRPQATEKMSAAGRLNARLKIRCAGDEGWRSCCDASALQRVPSGRAARAERSPECSIGISLHRAQLAAARDSSIRGVLPHCYHFSPHQDDRDGLS
jgi:hypothetical protein